MSQLFFKLFYRVIYIFSALRATSECCWGHKRRQQLEFDTCNSARLPKLQKMRSDMAVWQVTLNTYYKQSKNKYRQTSSNFKQRWLRQETSAPFLRPGVPSVVDE
jgi:hypothetical protein